MAATPEFDEGRRAIRRRWRESRSDQVTSFVDGACSFVPNLLPEDAIALPVEDALDILRKRYGDGVDDALVSVHTDPDAPAVAGIRSKDPRWILRSNIVGVNIRTIGTFAEVAKYTLTLPDCQNAIHLLPFWEPGVVASLYGMSSWEINDEFFSMEWATLMPHLDSPSRQLKALVNLLHATGRTVGMDVIPHTDRFSEIVLSNPRHFEWLRRKDTRIVDHRANLHEEVEELVVAFSRGEGFGTADLFDLDEATRNRLLFGPPEAPLARRQRRTSLARCIYGKGYEPVPATMAPPYRGLEVDSSTVHVDEDGHPWRDYRVSKPQAMSRVFGPLTRYKLYERLDDNRHWEIDFSRPRTDVWDYVCDRFANVQRSYGFDFMRGDMSHVQMRSEGVPPEPGDYYDLLGAVKRHIARKNEVPGFAYFAETFMSPPNVMAYGNEVDHLEAATAEATLGDLQSVPMGSDEFLQRIRRYLDVAQTRTVVPACTVMTGDKDDPRFDEFYLAGNEVRLFLALLLRDTPSYMALNFEVRDIHRSPAPNEHYTKHYVFHEDAGPKATTGPFRFGRNGRLFYRLSRIRHFADRYLPRVADSHLQWLLPPDATAGQRVVAWGYGNDVLQWVCVANTGTKGPSPAIRVPLPPVPRTGVQHRGNSERHLVPVFSTEPGRGAMPDQDSTAAARLVFDAPMPYLHLDGLLPSEGRVYKVG